MALVSYVDPVTEHIVERQVTSETDALETVAAARNLRGSRGSPAVQATRPDGSSLSVAYDGERATLVWIDSLGEPFHSVGGTEGLAISYDCFGSWTEAPASSCVAAQSATTFFVAFAVTGEIGDDIMFEPG